MSARAWDANGAAGTFFFQACLRGGGGARRRSEKLRLPSASWAALFTEWRKESCAHYKCKCPLAKHEARDWHPAFNGNFSDSLKLKSSPDGLHKHCFTLEICDLCERWRSELMRIFGIWNNSDWGTRRDGVGTDDRAELFSDRLALCP